ncbi:MAG: biotin-dependent carboxyltransferase family protein [Acidobacteriota bacterium]|nr:biotin-dependent carboxyltransferase family protein [Acidobacteriota bacterium]
MSIFVQKSGFLSTIQDLGRNGFRRFGINPNGAMDKQAARLINILLGNDETEAVLEIHFPAPILEFEEDAVITLGGAVFGAQLNGQKVENWRCFFVRKGSVLEFKKKVFGSRAYLAVKGGFAIKKWLGSSSTNLLANIGGFAGRALRKGDKLAFNSKFQIPNSKFNYKISNSLIPDYQKSPVKLRVIKGAEFELLKAVREQIVLKQNFTIRRESDRMGFRLTGEPLFLVENKELISSAIDFGTIQLLPDGQMIILMADHQTSGGYPRIAHVIGADLPILAQLNPNDKVGFELVAPSEAEDLLLEFERELSWLKIGCQYAFER